MSIKDEFRRPISQVITFLGSNRPLVVDGVTAEPALARKVAPRVKCLEQQTGQQGR
ncbi:MAG: hypothetical protein WBB44_10170 [Candidatus Nanopelagicales bacterium]|nr:hypothetical protein [Candidatus Nanopelagicales bacterium]